MGCWWFYLGRNLAAKWSAKDKRAYNTEMASSRTIQWGSGSGHLMPDPDSAKRPGQGAQDSTNSVTGGAGKAEPLVVAFVAPILSDCEVANYPAASPPGNRFQHGVLSALLAHDIETSVIALRPVSSYPRSQQLFFRGADGLLSHGVPYRQIGFINAGPLKTLTAAFTSFFAIWRWVLQQDGKRRVILFYNAYNPSAWVGILAGWLTRRK